MKIEKRTFLKNVKVRCECHSELFLLDEMQFTLTLCICVLMGVLECCFHTDIHTSTYVVNNKICALFDFACEYSDGFNTLLRISLPLRFL